MMFRPTSIIAAAISSQRLLTCIPRVLAASSVTSVISLRSRRFHGEVTITPKDAPFLNVARFHNKGEYDELVKPLSVFLSRDRSDAPVVPGEIIKFTKSQIKQLLAAQPGSPLETALFVHADSVTSRFFGNKVFFRGLIEFSNICEKDCHYCGLRSSMNSLDRFVMTKEDILDAAMFAHKNKYGSIMLQSGEVKSKERLKFVADIIRTIRAETLKYDADHGMQQPQGLGIAISLGELPRESYKELMAAGAHRYLLRIESSNKELYESIHPKNSNHSWENRVRCLRNLKDLGYQLGTGIMVGLPNQTHEDLANDVFFFEKLGADMIGIGPYLPQAETPLGELWHKIHKRKDEAAILMHNGLMFQLATKVNSIVRIHLGNVNIAATTALQACVAVGREIAIRRGANVLMPILTKEEYREYYQLYDNKPCVHDTRGQCMNCLTGRVATADKEVAWRVWGDPLHHFEEAAAVPTPSPELDLRLYGSKGSANNANVPGACSGCNLVDKISKLGVN